MKKLNNEQINTIVELLKEGKPLPEEYRELFFENKQETELIYAGKMREVDALAETMAVPLQKVKVFGNVNNNEWHDMLIFGDNLQILKTLLKMKEDGKLKNPDGSKGAKLIYIDPPFGTGEIYGKGNVGAYSAKLIGAKYLEWLRQRIILLKELLSDDGSFYMRTDYHFGHYMKVLLDEVFGKENFRNEIIINRTRRLKSEGKKFYTSTDSVFFYTKSDSYYFKHINIEEPYEIKVKLKENVRTDNSINKLSEVFVDCEIKIEKGRLLLRNQKWVEMHASSKKLNNPARIFLGKEIKPPRKRRWMWNQQQIDEMIKKGFIRINPRNGLPELIRTWRHLGSDWADIKGYSQSWNYPTENSEELLDRIIRAGSNGGDIILDAFAGSGTTGAVAEKLGRRWIVIDSSKFAIYTMIKRMLNLKEKIGNKGKLLKPKAFAVYNAGLYDMKMLKELPFKEYRKFALELFQCKDEPHILAGIDLDGYFGENHVLVFKWKKNTKGKIEYVMDRGFVDNLHSILGDRISKRFFIIAPAASVLFLEDYIEKDGIKYYVLRIPYSVIDELHKKNFKLLEQPISADISEVNKVMEQVGFDFIYPPDVECEYYVEKPEDKLFKEAVIKIKKFKSNIISKKPIPEEKLGFKVLSMVMIDYNFNREYFDMDDKWFASNLEKNNYEIRFPIEKLTEQMMIIYMDVYGNERKEIKGRKDFKAKR